MKITVFGATGRVGRIIVAECLKRGHTVKAFVHGVSTFEPHENLELIQGDIYEPNDVARAVDGSDAVISALGSWGTKGKDVLTTGMSHIIPAMKSSGITRIISLTGADARFMTDKPNMIQWITHRVFSTIAPSIMIDGESHIKLLAQSGLDWTVVRSPVMNERGKADKYVLRQKLSWPWQTIHRSAVAKAMTDQIEDTSFYKQSPVIHRS